MSIVKSVQSLKQRYAFLQAGYVAVAIVFLFFSYQKYLSDLNFEKNYFVEKQKAISEKTVDDFESHFKILYQSIRTMSLLPGTRSLDHKNTKLGAETKEAIQQIYNSAFLNFKLSEIYILPNKFDPHKKDPKTLKLQEPLYTFDELIINAGKGRHAEKSELPEEEIFEYEVMAEQINYFRKNYSTFNLDNLQNVPAVSGHEVITCDNSEFTKENLDSGNNEHRNGFVYSVPVYNNKGNFVAAISAIIRTDVLKSLLPDGNFQIVNSQNNVKISKTPSLALVESTNYFSKNQVNPNLIYNQLIPLQINDNSKWQLWTAVDNAVFYKSKEYQFLQKALFARTMLIFLTLFVISFFGFKNLKGQVYFFNRNQELELELKERTEKLELAYAKLATSAKMSALGEMASGVAHEINNPLSIIMSLSESTLRKLKANMLYSEKINSDLEKILRMGQRISKIVQGLKSFSRNSKADSMQLCQSQTILENSLEICQEKFNANQIQLKIKQVSSIEFECHGSQIEQILINLLINSLDALIEDSGNVNKWVEVNVINNQEKVIFSVTDSGKGISTDVAHKIMQPFFTTKKIGSGTGLGLSISVGIANDHKGQLYYDSNCPNTRFVLELPLNQNQQIAA